MKKFYILLVITIASTFQTFGQKVLRTPLYEEFTSSTCGPCYYGNLAFDPIIVDEHINDVALVKYQMNWPGNGDPYYTLEGYERRSFYSINSVPSLIVNGVQYAASVSAFSESDYEASIGDSTPVAITLSHEVIGQTVNIDLDIEILEDIDIAVYRVYVAIVEKMTTENVRTNGETEFHYVMKKMLPDGGGEFILETNGLPQDSVLSYDLSYEFQGSYDNTVTASNPVDHSTAHTVEEFSDLEVVAWIQELENKEVLQAKATWLPEPTSVNNVTSEASTFGVFPNPASDVVNIQLSQDVAAGATINLYDVVGNLVEQKSIAASNASQIIQFDTKNLNAGVYFIKLRTNDASETTQKLIVQ
tara:strand:- start:1487 stop:2566 length:1080 start_codon:yes stop_codon:yes gene_type:complete